jgi:hypothetical protein
MVARRSFPMVCLALLFPSLLPGALRAQTKLDALDVWQRQAQQQLYQHRVSLGLDDMTHAIGIGQLAQGASHSFTFTAQGPGVFRVLAVCDNDCLDVDLTLYDMGGNQIDIDVETDDFPWVDTDKLPVGTSRQFRVEVSMASCSADPCRYALAVFAM